MDVSLIFKIAGVGIIVSVLFTIIKQAGRDEIAYTILLSGLAITFYWSIQMIGDLFDKVKSVFSLY